MAALAIPLNSNRIMGLISSLFVHKVIAVATADQPDAARRRQSLFASVGVDPELPADPGVMVPDGDYYALCERVAREDSHGASVSVRVGRSMRCEDYGAFGLAWKTALNLRGSYARAERYGKVLTSVSTYELATEDGKHFMRLLRAGERRLGLRMSNEQTIAAMTEISREVCQEHFRPEAVFFRHPAPDDVSAHEAYFECDVHFSADRDGIQVSEELLHAPNRLGDQSVSRYFDTVLDEALSAMPDDNDLARRARDFIARALSQGVPPLSDTAASLGVSRRTLQRRLADEGFSYQGLVDAARRELAERMLRLSDYSLAEIAFLTGFSDQSAFNRAFRRWVGQTPRSFRLAAQSPG